MSLITKLDLSDDDVLECKKVIYRIVGMENNNEPLPVPGVGARGKGAKRYACWFKYEHSTLIIGLSMAPVNH